QDARLRAQIVRRHLPPPLATSRANVSRHIAAANEPHPWPPSNAASAVPRTSHCARDCRSTRKPLPPLFRALWPAPPTGAASMAPHFCPSQGLTASRNGQEVVCNHSSPDLLG